VGYTIKVATDDVQSKASAVASEVAELEAQLAKLSSDMRALADTWTGQAATAFQSLYANWGKQATAIQHSLNEIGLSLKGAGSKYADAEAANIASMR
jgi:early secretory antigenic target protein ESAT-6